MSVDDGLAFMIERIAELEDRIKTLEGNNPARH
jgi:hypothetical protein